MVKGRPSPRCRHLGFLRLFDSQVWADRFATMPSPAPIHSAGGPHEAGAHTAPQTSPARALGRPSNVPKDPMSPAVNCRHMGLPKSSLGMGSTQH